MRRYGRTTPDALSLGAIPIGAIPIGAKPTARLQTTDEFDVRGGVCVLNRCLPGSGEPGCRLHHGGVGEHPLGDQCAGVGAAIPRLQMYNRGSAGGEYIFGYLWGICRACIVMRCNRLLAFQPTLEPCLLRRALLFARIEKGRSSSTTQTRLLSVNGRCLLYVVHT